METLAKDIQESTIDYFVPTSDYVNVSLETSKGYIDSLSRGYGSVEKSDTEIVLLNSSKRKSINDVPNEFHWHVKKPIYPQMNQPNGFKVEQFQTLQKWEGYIVAIDGENIIVRLKDITNGGIDEEAEFTFSDVSEDDKPLIEEGAVFYWNLGYQITKGTRKKASIIRFRRLPAISKLRHQHIFSQAQQAFNRINWE